MKRRTSGHRAITDATTPSQRLDRYDVHPDVIDGDRVIHKTATGAQRKTLRREASVMAQMSSRHVVRFMELVETDSSTDLITSDAGSRTLADPTKIAPLELVRALRDCVEGVRELHASGWEHGGLEPAHVIVGARGRIRFCSLGLAKRLSGTIDGQVEHDVPSQHTGDVAALIRLVNDVGSSEVTDGAWRERRERLRLNREVTRAASTARDLLRTTGSPLEVLGQLDNLLGQIGAPLRARHRPHTTGQPDAKHTRSARVRRVGLVMSATIFGVLALASATSNGAYGITAVPASVPGPSLPTTTPPSTTIQVAKTNNIVIANGTSYTVGSTGDVAVVGDWKCNGTDMVALLRRSTGEVFIFDDWARPDEPSAGRTIGIHPGATGINAETTACDTIVVDMADGHTIDIPIGEVVDSGDQVDHNDITNEPGVQDR